MDSHYHKPEFQLLEAKLRERHPGIRRLDHYSEVVCGPFGTEITLDDYRESGFPLLRISNITAEGVIDETDLAFLSLAKGSQLSSTQVRPGDLVISQRGTLGMPAVVPSSFPLWNISANLIAIRNVAGLRPDFVAAFIATSPGSFQLQRRHSGQVQGKITTEDVASIQIPLFASSVQAELMAQMTRARAARRRKLQQASALLAGMDAFVLNRLGLTMPDSHNRPAYAMSLSIVRDSKQIGADYFHPERLNALCAIQAAKKTKRAARLEDVADFLREHTTEYEPEQYLGLAGVQTHTGELTETTEEPGKGQASIFKEDDVLFARLRPYLNKVWRAERNGVCSTEFHVIRIREDVNDLLPDYLAAVLRSSLIVAQTKHMMTGNTHPRLANEDVVDLLIPIPDETIQREIVDELRRRRMEARRLREEAAREWEEAKARFEARLLSEEFVGVSGTCSRNEPSLWT